MKFIYVLLLILVANNSYAMDEFELLCDRSLGHHETEIQIDNIDNFKKDLKKLIRKNKHDEVYYSAGEDVTSIIFVKHTDDPIFSDSESFEVYSGEIYNGSEQVEKLLHDELKLKEYDVPSGCVMLEDLSLKRNLRKISKIELSDEMVKIEYKEGVNSSWYQYAKEPKLVEEAKRLIQIYRSSGEIKI